MNILFLGGKQAGCVGMLTLLAKGHKIAMAVAYDPMVESLAKEFNIPVCGSVGYADYDIWGLDLIISVHGREKISSRMLKRAKRGGINVHPCLSKYKGESVSPITRLLQNKDHMASVGVHWMTDEIDGGPVILELPVKVTGKTENEVYNELYPYYAIAISQALGRV